MLRVPLVFLLLFAVSTPNLHLQAQTPAPVPTPIVATIELKAPVKVAVGELVVIDASSSVASAFAWDVSPPSKDYIVIENGKRLIFSSRVSGEYVITIAVAKSDTVALKIHHITVTGASPAPNDIQSKIGSWCELVKSSDTKLEASKLAMSFNNIASITESGVFETPAAVLTATKKANQDALGDARQNWAPFFEQLQKELTALAEAGKLNDTASHAAMWRSIAEGLKAYASQ